MESFTLHGRCRGDQADIGSHSCNDKMILASVSNSLCKSWIVPCIDNSLSLDAVLVRLGRGLLDHVQEQTLYIGFPKAFIVTSAREFKIDIDYIDEVSTSGILVAVANVARIFTFFSRRVASME